MPIKKHFDPAKHPRKSKGSKGGGQFARKNGGDLATQNREAAKRSESGLSKEAQILHNNPWLDPNREFLVVMKAWGGPEKLMRRRERKFPNHTAWVDFVNSGVYEIDQVVEVVQKDA